MSEMQNNGRKDTSSSWEVKAFTEDDRLEINSFFCSSGLNTNTLSHSADLGLKGSDEGKAERRIHPQEEIFLALLYLLSQQELPPVPVPGELVV